MYNGFMVNLTEIIYLFMVLNKFVLLIITQEQELHLEFGVLIILFGYLEDTLKVSRKEETHVIISLNFFIFEKCFSKDSANDLWKWDGIDWTWISGSNVRDQPGNYGTKETASSINIPGARDSSVSWIGLDGSFWLFGGYGFDNSSNKVNSLQYFIF